MQLTEPQQRTLDQLIGTERPVFPADLPQRLRDRIEQAARDLELGDPLWLGKERLNDLDRCEGTFWSKLAGEGPAFAHSRATALGGVQHPAIEGVVGARETLEPHDAAPIAATRAADPEEWGRRGGRRGPRAPPTPPRPPPHGPPTVRSGSRSIGAISRPPSRTTC